MENSKADKQAKMTLIEMVDAVGKAKAMVSFIAGTLLMASNSPFEIDEDWFGELSLYANDVADVLEPVIDSLAATRATRDAEILGFM